VSDDELGLDVQVENLDKLLSRMQPELYAKPLRDFWNRVGTSLANEIKTASTMPVDSGRGRASMTHVVDQAEPPLWTQVGTNLLHMRWMNWGTGLLSIDPESSRQRHWPPGEALDVWASRHGFESGSQVARRIGMRGGLKPRKFMEEAVGKVGPILSRFIEDLRREITQRWGD